MATIISAGIGTDNAIFPEILVREMFNAVAGKSSVAKMSQARPVSFVGNTEFVFTMDSEADIVAENGAKTNGGAAFNPVHIVPVKFEYGTRVSDEFIYASEEQRLETLRTFTEGAARKFARALDIGAIRGVNPRTGQPSAVIGTNNLVDKGNSVTYTAATPDANLEEAVTTIQNYGGTVNGVIMSPAFSAAMAGLKVNGVPQYPELRFGSVPEDFYGLRVDVNSTLPSTGDVKAVVGDFDGFRWGYAKDITFEVIRYGNPDNDTNLGDLRGHNQVYLRCEAYIGWGVLDGDRFAVIAAE